MLVRIASIFKMCPLVKINAFFTPKIKGQVKIRKQIPVERVEFVCFRT